MSTYKSYQQLQVSSVLDDFVAHQLCPPLGIEVQEFWSNFAVVLRNVRDQNRTLLAKRDQLQAQIDAWHKQNHHIDQTAYQAFLHDIGYLVPEQGDCTITTSNVDTEITTMAGPQLVVPVNNARFALNAANARWGSLYDALYGTDVIDDADGREKTAAFNTKRAQAVIAWVNQFLDSTIPLIDSSHADVVGYEIDSHQQPAQLIARTNTGTTGLENPAQFVGFVDSSCVLLAHNNLHIAIHIDPSHPIGALHQAGVKDVVLESALTTIMDCEDSVAAVDAQDKTLVYQNWLGLMRGTLEASVQKGNKTITRSMAADRTYTAPDGSALTLHGRSLLFVRNVGHLMTTDAVLDEQGNEVPEGVLDAFVTVACAMHDMRGLGVHKNSRTGSVYIVKPKMHGPQEVAFADQLFSAVEEAFGLASHTIKVGIMDEERRTSANLLECIRAVKERIVFINTGFLDRTGDEIHTSMEAGAMLPKSEIKTQNWIGVYEDRNVDIGLACGFSGKAQIGKGMWPMPDEMKQMLETKQAHPLAGANCAWVPSPTAATLHALHYHQVDIFTVQTSLRNRHIEDSLTMLLTPPLMRETPDAKTIQQELDNNAQGILGYVVRWIDQGIGCSKVPDIHNVGLMEDRATLRISSQHIANWLHHGICSETQVMESMERMAQVVDEQNADDPHYTPMTDDLKGSVAFAAACDLVLKGCEQPNGYTEPLLHTYRKSCKRG